MGTGANGIPDWDVRLYNDDEDWWLDANGNQVFDPNTEDLEVADWVIVDVSKVAEWVSAKF